MDFYTRETAKAEAARRGVKYRMTSGGMVDFYGRMPNTDIVGWYLAGWHRTDYAKCYVRAIHPNDPDAEIRTAFVVREWFGHGLHGVTFPNTKPNAMFPLDILAWEPLSNVVYPAWLEI